jgi:hypothetical protein
MALRLRFVVPCAAFVSFALASAAQASDKPRRIHHTIEGEGVVATQLLPHAYFGGDAAYVIGNDTFGARFGGLVLGGRPFALGEGKIGNVLAVATLDGCGSRQVFRHRVRMCVGAQGGAMAHHWIGYDRPGRKATPWVAGALRGDYRYSVTERVGVMFGVSVSLPVIGPEFRARDSSGTESPLVFPGPVTGMLTLGATFRVR